MTGIPNTLIITCPTGHWLAKVGPDREEGGRVTMRWHAKHVGGYRIGRGPYPTPLGEPGLVRVGCRDTNVADFDIARIADLYAQGVRGRWSIVDLARLSART